MLDRLITELSSQKPLSASRQKALLLAAAALVEMRDPVTAGHSTRVGNLSATIARELGLIPDIQGALRLAGLVHDIGKIGVPKAYLLKAGKLTEAEMAEIRKHPGLSYEIVSEVPGLIHIAQIVLHHHERLDGRGYPDRLAGDEIPLGSRILCVADSLDAMVTERAYRPPLPISAAIDELQRCAGTQFDPVIVEALKAYLLRKDLQLP
ncbi:MAG: HD-GYP domain-containing protein [Firmicutes bacterium]|nr:HD-GYP domain-containing protein [Bacillota bacterium]MDH7494408.1 HD-GYP domain-containing protein [Bacillota bacterium]